VDDDVLAVCGSVYIGLDAVVAAVARSDEGGERVFLLQPADAAVRDHKRILLFNFYRIHCFSSPLFPVRRYAAFS